MRPRVTLQAFVRMQEQISSATPSSTESSLRDPSAMELVTDSPPAGTAMSNASDVICTTALYSDK